MLGLGSVCAFLPQTDYFVPFAAFFMAVCFALCLLDRTRKTALCLLLGAVAGIASVHTTNARLEQLRVRYAGRSLVLTAEVEQTSTSYLPGRVDAVLHVQQVNDHAADLRISCEGLPACTAGQQVQGRFVLAAPDRDDRCGLYADGVALTGQLDLEKEQFTVLGQSQSFRARTYRLQQRLSASLRRRMDGSTGGVLAAMTVGDRQHLSTALRSAYRGAGLSHVLVVSGLHVSILCGEIFGALPFRRRRERSYRSRRAKALWSAVLALLLVGVTGFTPSVCRAAVAVWVAALGVWVYGPPDALNSLAAAGILMTAGNSYAVYDIGFELSFAAVLGTLAGAACARRGKQAWRAFRQADKPRSKPGIAARTAATLWNNLLESLCVAVCASAATFPVLVLRGLSVSVWAVVSSVAVLWLVKPMLLLGLGAALTGLVPGAAPVYRALSHAAAFLTRLLNGWAVWLSAKPGAGLYFDTAYAALVCLVVCGLAWLAYHWKVRWRVALPGLLLVAGVAVGLGNALSRDVVHIDLVGSGSTPAVVITQGDAAVVLFRGGSSAQRKVENQLARRGVRTVELVADLRIRPQSACTLPAQQMLCLAEMEANTAQKLRCTPALVEVLRTRKGGLVRVTIGNRQFVALSGNVQLAEPLQAEWLLASPADPDAVQWQKVLALRTYDWMEQGTTETLPASLSLRRHGGWKAE